MKRSRSASPRSTVAGRDRLQPGRYIVLESPRPVRTPRSATSSRNLRACTEGAVTVRRTALLRGKVPAGQGASSTASAVAKALTEQDRRWTTQGHRRAQLVLCSPPASAGARTTASTSTISDSGGKSGGQKREARLHDSRPPAWPINSAWNWGAVRSRSFRFVVIDEAFGRGSDESAQYGLGAVPAMNLQLLIVTPLQKIHIIEPTSPASASSHNEGGRASQTAQSVHRGVPGAEGLDASQICAGVGAVRWTGPKESKAQLARLWERGELLRDAVTGNACFPLRLSIKSPSSADITDRFDEVRDWAAELVATDSVRVEWQELRHRVQGAQKLPASAWVETIEDALSWLGKRREWEHFSAQFPPPGKRTPLLPPWLEKRPRRRWNCPPNGPAYWQLWRGWSSILARAFTCGR